MRLQLARLTKSFKVYLKFKVWVRCVPPSLLYTVFKGTIQPKMNILSLSAHPTCSWKFGWSFTGIFENWAFSLFSLFTHKHWEQSVVCNITLCAEVSPLFDVTVRHYLLFMRQSGAMVDVARLALVLTLLIGLFTYIHSYSPDVLTTRGVLIGSNDMLIRTSLLAVHRNW